MRGMGLLPAERPRLGKQGQGASLGSLAQAASGRSPQERQREAEEEVCQEQRHARLEKRGLGADTLSDSRSW